MCGIAGIVSKDGFKSGLILRMTNPIRHRGPNDEGYVLFRDISAKPLICGGDDTPSSTYGGTFDYAPIQPIDAAAGTPATLAFGHRRLSIVDLSTLGHQPMSYADGRYWITYNGEIYNHLELREELESLGHSFISHTDTEVLLAAYAQWGSECLPRLNGMWAFAILDRQEATLFIARDRFGVKPLYYWVSPEGIFAFASEIKQFEPLPGWRARLNPQRTYDFLVFGLTDHTHETMFAGLFQLKPGHSMSIDLQRIGELPPNQAIETKPWYLLQATPFSGTFTDACDKFRQTFMDAVKLRLRADVPVGSCLSGGLDSSSIVCMMNELLAQQDCHANQKTFSACSDVEIYNERKWIDIVVDKTGVDAHYIYPPLDKLFAESEQIAWHQDEPFGSTSIYAQWNVFKLASGADVKVMLDGQGADEYLAGYHGFFGARLAGLVRGQRWAELLREALAMRRIHAYSLSNLLMFLANHLLPHSVADVLKEKIGHTHSTPSWLNLKVLRAEPIDPKYTTGAREGSLYTLSISQLTSSIQMLLHWEDRNSMAHSIESRVPFLDYRLVELVLGFPDEFKLSQGVTKRVLRQAMQGVLPAPIANRMDKLGFVTPEEVWLRENATEVWRAKVNEAIDRTSGMIERHEFNKHLDAIIAGTAKFSYLPWRLISLGQWMQRFNVSI